MSNFTYLPMLFECSECEHTDALISGKFVIDNNGDYHCVPCAKIKFGTDEVESALISQAYK